MFPCVKHFKSVKTQPQDFLAKAWLFLTLFLQVEGMRYALYQHAGGSVTFPCDNLHECSQITWLYQARGQTFVLVDLGKLEDKDKETWSLEPNCSLTLHKVTPEKATTYTCRQFYGQGVFYDRNTVDLSVLTLSSSPPSPPELRPGSQVTLNCSLITKDGTCNTNLKLRWLQGDSDLQQDDRHHISSPTHCDTYLTTTLLPEQAHSEFKCQIEDPNGNMLISDDIAFTQTGSGMNSSHDENSSTTIIAAAAMGAAALCLLLAVVFIICRRKSRGRQLATADKTGMSGISHLNSPTPDGSQAEPYDNVTYAFINTTTINAPSKENFQPQDVDVVVVYSEVYKNGRTAAEDASDVSVVYACVDKTKT